MMAAIGTVINHPPKMSRGEHLAYFYQGLGQPLTGPDESHVVKEVPAGPAIEGDQETGTPAYLDLLGHRFHDVDSMISHSTISCE